MRSYTLSSTAVEDDAVDATFDTDAVELARVCGGAAGAAAGAMDGAACEAGPARSCDAGARAGGGTRCGPPPRPEAAYWLPAPPRCGMLGVARCANDGCCAAPAPGAPNALALELVMALRRRPRFHPAASVCDATGSNLTEGLTLTTLGAAVPGCCCCC